VNVLLDDAGTFGRLCVFNDDGLELVPFFSHLDTRATVRALAGLRDPDIVSIFVRLVVLLEDEVVWIVKSLLDMEGDRQRIKGVLPDRLVVALHVVQECLFVAKVVVILDFIRQLDGESIYYLHFLFFLNWRW